MSVTVGAAPAADLVVDPPTVSERAPDAGVRFTLNATVRNQGNGRSDSATLRYYRSSDSTITTGDTEVGTDYVFRLDASENGDESVSLTAPSTPGTYYYGACVDSLSDELDTTNNCSVAVTVTVGAAPAPDLVMDTPTVSENAPAAGARFTLNATVQNQGNGASTFTTLRYYRSTDSTITSSDTSVGTDSVSGLSSSRSSDRVDQSDRVIHTWDVLLRRVRGRGDRGVRHDEQLLTRGDCICRCCTCAGPCGGHAHGGRDSAPACGSVVSH